MDNRQKNTYFTSASITAYVNAYSVTLRRAIESVHSRALDSAVRCLRDARRVFVCGNGGSASIAEHWTCDHSVGLRGTAVSRPVVALTANSAVLTACANDFGYDLVFAKQLEFHGFAWGDVLVAVSSSGSSPNVVNAASYACGQGAHVITLTGFSGQPLRGHATHALHVDAANYGVIEDAHSALMHCLAQYLFVTDPIMQNPVDACGAI